MNIEQEVKSRTGVELLHVIHTRSVQQKWIMAGKETAEGKPVYYTMNVKPGLGVKFVHPLDGRTICLGIHKKTNKQPVEKLIDRICDIINHLIFPVREVS